MIVIELLLFLSVDVNTHTYTHIEDENGCSGVTWCFGVRGRVGGQAKQILAGIQIGESGETESGTGPGSTNTFDWVLVKQF